MSKGLTPEKKSKGNKRGRVKIFGESVEIEKDLNKGVSADYLSPAPSRERRRYKKQLQERRKEQKHCKTESQF